MEFELKLVLVPVKVGNVTDLIFKYKVVSKNGPRVDRLFDSVTDAQLFLFKLINRED